jgi:hypothetical protein
MSINKLIEDKKKSFTGNGDYYFTYITLEDCKKIVEEALKQQSERAELGVSLLKKYMLNVMDNEGVSFIENANDAFSKVKFTDSEIEKLKEIHKEALIEH